MLGRRFLLGGLLRRVSCDRDFERFGGRRGGGDGEVMVMVMEGKGRDKLTLVHRVEG